MRTSPATSGSLTTLHRSGLSPGRPPSCLRLYSDRLWWFTHKPNRFFPSGGPDREPGVVGYGRGHRIRQGGGRVRDGFERLQQKTGVTDSVGCLLSVTCCSFCWRSTLAWKSRPTYLECCRVWQRVMRTAQLEGRHQACIRKYHCTQLDNTTTNQKNTRGDS